jgi:hypothetical protein
MPYLPGWASSSAATTFGLAFFIRLSCSHVKKNSRQKFCNNYLGRAEGS